MIHTPSNNPRHPELVSGPIGPQAQVLGSKFGGAVWGKSASARQTEGWVLKQVQDDEEG
jgi:hypothetical protein